MDGDNYAGRAKKNIICTFRFKVVDAFDAKEADLAKIELKKLREQGENN